MNSAVCPGIAFLLDGIPVPQAGITIPWLVTESEFPKFALEAKLIFSPARWPQMDFELLGLSARWGFNFVSDEDKRLTSISHQTLGKNEANDCYIRTRDHLRRLLGIEYRGNNRDRQTWRHIGIYVTNEITTGYFPMLRETEISHSLTVGVTQELQDELLKTSRAKR